MKNHKIPNRCIRGHNFGDAKEVGKRLGRRGVRIQLQSCQRENCQVTREFLRDKDGKFRHLGRTETELRAEKL